MTSNSSNSSSSGSGSGSSSQSFDAYLKQFYLKPGEVMTHTRIPDKKMAIAGGTYCVPDAELPNFYAKYYDHVFVKGKHEFLTERQHDEGPLLVDFDLHYDAAVVTRQHSKEHVFDMIQLYAEEIPKLMTVKTGETIPVYIFEKSDVNKLDDKTKDGIHMMIGITMDRVLQTMLRSRIMAVLPEVWSDLPIKNTWNEVLDESITRGSTNWQLYGSRKPGHKVYMLKYYYLLVLDEDGEWNCEEPSISKFSVKDNFQMLTARYKNYSTYPVVEAKGIKDEYERVKNTLNMKNGGANAAAAAAARKIRMISNGTANGGYDGITNMDQLKKAVDNMLETLDLNDTKELVVKETHDYVMILPEKYYNEYANWIRVGIACHNTHEKLFLTWVLFSAKSSKFVFSQIPEFYQRWCGFGHSTPGNELTMRSIMFWGKRDALEEYKKVHEQSLDYYVELTINSQTSHDMATEVDLAIVLYQMTKDNFVCSSIKNNTWYQFTGHRWEVCEQASSLRIMIHRTMHDLYTRKHTELMNLINTVDPSSEQHSSFRKRTRRVVDICTKLKSTTFRNNIMREVRELFFVKDFESMLDTKEHLLGFNNGVVDFKEKIFRNGQPDDYISMCTNIDYVELNPAKHQPIMDQITDFMEKLFQLPNLRRYMWDHLASVLIGGNPNQTFNIYLGGGSNGKSLLVKLMSMCLGDYKVTVPVSLITDKRPKLGGTSSEMAMLKGTRYAVMQEPSKGARLHEGSMKDLTGGDPIQARALYHDPVTFVPQCKFALCTNVLLEVNSNDQGTWRRIKACEFMSTFTYTPVQDDPDQPYQFLIDPRLEEKMKDWVNVFMAMLVKRAYETSGLVADCDEVRARSDKYRNTQDYLSEFIRDKIRFDPANDSACLSKTSLYEEFKNWYTIQYSRNTPKGTELYEQMDKRFGKASGKGWKGVSIIYNYDDPTDE